MAAAISSYLSACSASLAFCTSCSRSTILKTCAWASPLCFGGLKEKIGDVEYLNAEKRRRVALAAAAACCLCACRRDTPPPPSTFPRLCHHPKRRVLAEWCNEPGSRRQRSLLPHSQAMEGWQSHTSKERELFFFIFLLHSGDIMPCCSITLSLLFKYSHHKAKAWPGKPVWGGPSDLHGPPQRALTWPEGHAPPEAQNTQHYKGPPSSPWPTRLERGALSHLNHSIISSNAAPTLLIQPWGILHAIRLPRTKVINVMLQWQNAWRHAKRAISYPLANR